MKIVPMSCTLVDSMGSDLSVVNAARVSFNKESDWSYYKEPSLNFGKASFIKKKLSEKDQKLISYLAKHGHWTPFAHNSLTFRIKAPIFVARQLVKHQIGGVWNEVSRRYVSDEPEFYFPEYWRQRAENVKQGSSSNKVPFGWSQEEQIKSSVTHSLEAYNMMLDNGCAPEQARMVLPQNTMTEWWWTGSLAFFARVCKQRLDAHAQAETREIAQLIYDNIPEEFQYSWKELVRTNE